MITWREFKMLEELKKLKDLREQIEIIKGQYEVKVKTFEEENKTLIEQKQTLNNAMAVVENDLRTMALEKFKETGEKKLAFGVGIRVMTKLEYDNKVAFNWAEEHKMALTLDKKVFEKIAKAQDIDFVKKLEVPSATLPSKIEI